MAFGITVPRLRMVLVTGIAVTALAAGAAWWERRGAERENKPPPKRIPVALRESAQDFHISRSDGGRTVFKATAKKAVDFRDTGKSELEGVEVLLYGRSGDRADRILSDRCEYDQKTERIYSPGTVTIELASMPGRAPSPQQQPLGSGPMKIRTKGLTFEHQAQGGLAATDQPLEFEFHGGTGTARGAVYNSAIEELWLKSDVEFHIRETESGAGPVEVRAVGLRYHRASLQVHLNQPEFRRPGDGQWLRAANGLIFLDAGNQVQSAQLTGGVRGSQREAGRSSEFQAGKLTLAFATEGQRQRLRFAIGEGSVHVDSKTPAGRAEGFTSRLELGFEGLENRLRTASWLGSAKLIFHRDSSQPKSQTKTVTSERIETTLLADGETLETARTLAPGRVELTGGTEPRRVLEGNTLSAGFAAGNHLTALRAEGKVRTETDPPAGATGAGKRITTSDRLAAGFGGQSQQVETMDQSGNFEYTEGARRARGNRAVYTAATTMTELTGLSGADPQVWDPEVRVSAARIQMNEKTGESTAERGVKATRYARDGSSSGILGGAKNSKGGDPVNALTDRMRWDRASGVTRYEGGPGGKVRLWQGQDLLEAATVDMDRAGKSLTAVGDVYSFLVEEGKDPLRVNAARLVYNDQERKARYEQQVLLRSQDMTLTSEVLEVFLTPANATRPGASRLERALATGAVRMNQPRRAAAPGRPEAPARRAQADRVDYFATEDKMVLQGGPPVVWDEVRGSTTGRELTYFRADDRITVIGDESARTQTEHRVAKKPR